MSALKRCLELEINLKNPLYGELLNSSIQKIMELELKIVADNPRELINIAAKLSDLDAILKDDIPFMPEDLMSDGNLINSNEEHLTKPTMN